MAGFRKEKVEALMKRVIGDALLAEVKDPRIGFASVFRVEVSRDYSVADVFISVIGTKDQKEKAIKGLTSACGFIRSKVGKEMKMRFAPELKFHVDDSIEKGVGMVNLIGKLSDDMKSKAVAREEAEREADQKKEPGEES
jgi:ribosome-binding factor A